MPSIVQVNVTQTVAPAPLTLQASGAFVSQGATNTSPGTASLLTQLSDLTPLLLGAKALSAIACSSTTVTATAAAAHGFTVGDTIYLTIAGCAPAAYNGTWLCTITTTTAFTYSVPATIGSSTTVGSYTNEDVGELLAMATTFFAQGSAQAVYVLEFGAGSVNEGVAALSAYLTANPNSNYTAGAAGYFYSYLVPRTWDGNANFLALLAQYEATTAKTYFFVTTTLATYTLYTNLMKCVVPMIEAPPTGVWAANALTAISYSGGVVTGTTTTAHGVSPGQWLQIAGVTPSGYNGTFLAQPGTTGSTLVYNLAANPGAESVLGTLVASYYAQAAIPTTEFSLASMFYVTLAYAPSTINKVPPTAFSYVTDVTPYPVRGNSAILTTLKAADINVIGTGAEGGISNTIILWGTTRDGHDFTYWYSVDWVQLNLDEALANAVINGSNNPQNPLYYDQDGINRLLAVAKQVMNNAIAFGLALSPVTVAAVPFVTYVTANPTDYPAGIYRGIGVTYTPQRGFIQIIVNVDVTGFPAGG